MDIENRENFFVLMMMNIEYNVIFVRNSVLKDILKNI